MADFAEARSRLGRAFLERAPSLPGADAAASPAAASPAALRSQVSAGRLGSLASQVHLAEWSHSLLKEGPTLPSSPALWGQDRIPGPVGSTSELGRGLTFPTDPIQAGGRSLRFLRCRPAPPPRRPVWEDRSSRCPSSPLFISLIPDLLVLGFEMRAHFSHFSHFLPFQTGIPCLSGLDRGEGTLTNCPTELSAEFLVWTQARGGPHESRVFRVLWMGPERRRAAPRRLVLELTGVL